MFDFKVRGLTYKAKVSKSHSTNCEKERFRSMYCKKCFRFMLFVCIVLHVMWPEMSTTSMSKAPKLQSVCFFCLSSRNQELRGSPASYPRDSVGCTQCRSSVTVTLVPDIGICLATRIILIVRCLQERMKVPLLVFIGS